MLCGRVAGILTDSTSFVFPSQLVAPSQDNTLSLAGCGFGCCSGSPECESALGGSVSLKLDVKDLLGAKPPWEIPRVQGWTYKPPRMQPSIGDNRVRYKVQWGWLWEQVTLEQLIEEVVQELGLKERMECSRWQDGGFRTNWSERLSWERNKKTKNLRAATWQCEG